MIFDFLRKKKPEAEDSTEEHVDNPLAPESTEPDSELVQEPELEIPDNLLADSGEGAPEPTPEPAGAGEKLSVEEAPESAFDPAAELAGVAEPEAPESSPEPVSEAALQPATQDKPKKEGFFARIRRGLSRTSSQFAEGMGNLFLGAKEIDEDLMEELETQLLMADVGVDATTEIIDRLTERVSRRELSNGEALYNALQEELAGLLDKVEAPLSIDQAKKPFVILVVGVNGVGKTTTIGKMAHRYLNEGKSVMLAAGDTFRAAAVEQLQVWGQRHNVPVVAQHTGADSASVIFDAIQSAQSRGVDVVIADTAGRLHNKANLMEELSKVRRVMGKLDGSAPHEVLLVLDAGTGQNALSQAETFRDSAGVTGLVLTKLDGTAKGGVIFALAQKLGIPVRFIGVGEQAEDLQPFAAKDFVAALFNRSQG
ncbi:signal recognition particle-docking protein FtsY [Microbulbifer hydrolyticus]|uniref:Signal recognition particle receptor FtsY n=1 Tax=Microbulbifer hydrolyticus TaxID=48074 RepID=A0A6P1T741_9GAMM|nr:signal recognition particle-docking protein FtsY [Microbulbifer hydrolyticus]MBB5211645.1 fused signal recognition particle receptor [Microbulbifer hydrolyticus]QHQ37621.1 signal recognition particle-docking protein FtsY [Microbulbifer hydrolyticus]